MHELNLRLITDILSASSGYLFFKEHFYMHQGLCRSKMHATCTFFPFRPCITSETPQRWETTDTKELKSPPSFSRGMSRATHDGVCQRKLWGFRWSCDVTSAGTRLHRLHWDWLWHVHCSCDETLTQVCHLVYDVIVCMIHELRCIFSAFKNMFTFSADATTESLRGQVDIYIYLYYKTNCSQKMCIPLTLTL